MSGNIHSRADGTGGGTGTRNLTKTGNGTLVLGGGNNTYNGDTVVASGTLLVNEVLTANTTTNPIVSVSAVTILGGSGTINRAVSVSGTLSPGDGPGKLTINEAVSLDSTAVFRLELNGLTAGTGYDQIEIGGTGPYNFTVATGATLNATMGSFAANVGDRLWVVNNLTTGSVSGTFSGYADDSIVIANTNGFDWRITYNADFGSNSLDGGNDIAFYATAVPEPNVALMTLGGFGLLVLFRRRA